MLPTSSMIAKAVVGLLAAAATASASFTTTCRHICLAADQPNLLIAECTVNGTPTDKYYTWGQFDLNQVLGYQSPLLVFQQNGGFSVNNAPCSDCIMSGSKLVCLCTSNGQTLPSSLDLDDVMVDVTGKLCFATGNIGPICAADTARTC